MADAPRLSYLICSTPRSGSTLLCEALALTGVAGVPEEYYQHRRKTGLPRRPLEYFEDAGTAEVFEILGTYTRVDDEPGLFDPRRFESYRAYVDWTIERATTPNGVFGAKVMWGYFNGFVDSLRDVHNAAVMPTRSVLERTFPNLTGWVFVIRRDKVRQAVSLWKAIQNWTWRRDESDGGLVAHDLRYSFEAIDHLVRQLQEHEREWTAFFRENGLLPHWVVYEDLADRYAETTRDTLRYLGIDPPHDIGEAGRRMTRQADALSEEWVGCYQRDAAAPTTRAVNAASDLA